MLAGILYLKNHMEEGNILEKFNTPGKDFYVRLAKWAGIFFLVFTVLSSGLVLMLRWVDPPTSSFMIQRQLQADLAGDDSFRLQYEWVDWNNISDYLKVAAITSEDQRFPRHNGFDFEAIKQAIEENGEKGELRGASTITQQVAKNLFLWPGRSFIRKGIEAYFTVLIELFWSKKRILEIYLNIVEFGDGIYGVEAASNIFFNTSADELEIINCALMVTALPSPRRYDLGNPSPYMIERRNWVIEYMFYLGYTDYLKQLE